MKKLNHMMSTLPSKGKFATNQARISLPHFTPGINEPVCNRNSHNIRLSLFPPPPKVGFVNRPLMFRYPSVMKATVSTKPLTEFKEFNLSKPKLGKRAQPEAEEHKYMSPVRIKRQK